MAELFHLLQQIEQAGLLYSAWVLDGSAAPSPTPGEDGW